jgi:hypothetical protein
MLDYSDLKICYLIALYWHKRIEDFRKDINYFCTDILKLTGLLFHDETSMLVRVIHEYPNDMTNIPVKPL